MNNGDVITFDAKKNFTYIKPLGGGGTGDTHLFRDETTDMLFAFKKYVPKDARFIDEHDRRFVDEIKILFNISHPNIVRVYNYYNARKEIEVQTVIDFYGFVTSLSPAKQKILFDNIHNRLSTIKVEVLDDELPF